MKNITKKDYIINKIDKIIKNQNKKVESSYKKTNNRIIPYTIY